ETPVAEVPDEGVGSSGDRKPESAVLKLQEAAGNAAVSRMVSRVGSRALARLLQDNPGDIHDPTTGQSTTAWATPGVQDSLTQQGYATAPGTAAAPAALSAPTFIKPKATEATPFVGDTPAVTDLYEQQSAAASGFTSVSTIQGTLAAPVNDLAADS